MTQIVENNLINADLISNLYIEQETTFEEKIDSFTQKNYTKFAIRYVQFPTLASLPFTNYSNSFQLDLKMSLCQEGRPNGFLVPASLHQIPTPDTRLQDHSSPDQIPPPDPPPKPTGSSESKSGAKISSGFVPLALSH